MRTSPRLAIASLLLAACHSGMPRTGASPDYADERGIDRDKVLLSSWRPTTPQSCVVARYPETLPTAESLISTGDMPILLKQGGIEMSRGTALLSLKFDSTGHVARARVIEGTLAEDAGRVLEQVVLSAIQPQLPGREWGVRLLVDLDSVPRYRVGRAEHCAAVPTPSRVETAAATEHTVAGVAAGTLPSRSISPVAARTSTIKYLVAVDARGRVVEVKQVGVSSESAAFLDALQAHLARQVWLPELDDRIPVEAIVERSEQVRSVLAPAP
ncbi:MAG: hypothetical protein HOQ26_05820 [Gemmatimonadaceae bacterium]|nr:hypothetical protein [Gemmatimonadaceae bacterium]